MSKILIIFALFSNLVLAEEGIFYIGGEAVKSISMSLELSSINFGDVHNDSDIDSVLVDFYVNAEAGYDYQVEISNDDSSGVLQVSQTSSGGYTEGIISYDDTGTGSNQTHQFYVDLDTGNMNGDLSATITVTVIYYDIE
jgi:hypothetical protein